MPGTPRRKQEFLVTVEFTRKPFTPAQKAAWDELWRRIFEDVVAEGEPWTTELRLSPKKQEGRPSDRSS